MLCQPCRKIRMGENNDGETLERLMTICDNLFTELGESGLPMLAAHLKHGIPQAKKGGACRACLIWMESVEVGIAKRLGS